MSMFGMKMGFSGNLGGLLAPPVPPIATQPFLKYDALEGVTLFGSNVISWQSQGSNNLALDDSPSLFPLYATMQTPNGKPALHFVGGRQLDASVVPVGLPSGNSSRTLFMVVRFLSGEQTGWQNTKSTGTRRTLLLGVDQDERLECRFGGIGVGGVAFNNLNSNGWKVYSARLDNQGANLRIRLYDGETIGDDTTIGAVDSGYDTVRFRPGSADPREYYMNAFYLYGGLSDADFVQQSQHLRQSIGLPI